MASETSSCASSCLQSNEAPKELLELLSVLDKQQKQQQQQQLPQHGHNSNMNMEGKEEAENMPQQKQKLDPSIQLPEKTRMDLSQIELIYRAEGNANLVLALPQFKKVLRLPKIQQKQQNEQQADQLSLQELQQMNELKQQPQHQDTQYSQKCPGPNTQQQHRQQEQHYYPKQQQEHSKLKQQEPTNMTLTATGQQLLQQPQSANAVGILTMDHYVAYIGIIRCLLGNEFVFEADIVAVPNPNDRDWINEHIRPHRPVNRLDKEFGGHYGLLLPDATRLPAEFDILFSNLKQTKSKQQCPQRCCPAVAVQDAACGAGASNNSIFLEDTFAIEIKPKQGWLLPNDVNNLFDIKPATAAAGVTAMQQPDSLADVGDATSSSSSSSTSTGTLKTSADKECFTATQNKSSITKTTTSPLQKSLSAASKAATVGGAGAASHDKVDIRCRYCSMQFLKLQQKKILQRSNYCPIDLFSGVPARMWNALHALFTCPQNNLRIFKNGIVVFDDQLSRLSKIEDLFSSQQLQIIKQLMVICLLRDYTPLQQAPTAFHANLPTADDDDLAYDANASRQSDAQMTAMELSHDDDGKPQTSETTPCKKLKTIKAETGPESDVAKVNTTFIKANTTTRISTKSNSEMAAGITMTTTTTITPTTTTQFNDAKKSSLAYKASDSRPHCPTSVGADVSVKPKEKNIPEMLSLPKNCVLEKILNLQLLAKKHFPHMFKENYQKKKGKSYDILSTLLQKYKCGPTKLEISQLSAEEQYLLAATALDCSIMITFRQISNQVMANCLCTNPHMICIEGQHFITKITLLDLDPKPDTHFAKYVKQTHEIMQSIHS
ncbi:inositol-pentakisphosphate 2-kinase isoform X2 [Musca domestica]|uniref:inositol-pentakisphosphate 2-kinase n=1 Tax=Musca domestica TaxID=7370 RepID=A0A9J7DCV0_MUSDO|nr:inositol-pentakisphosphate 2-kinase isoform X2 [Musca domestica]